MTDQRTGSGYDANRDIVPILAVSREGYPEPRSFRGTGFLIGKNVLVTCWHCVREPLGDDETYAAAFPAQYAGTALPADTTYIIEHLSDIEQDPRGLDLATARVPQNPAFLTLGDGLGLPSGTGVWAYGFPLTEESRNEDGSLRVTLGGRYLQSYKMRDFYNEVAGFGRTPSTELDMPAPAGLSGAPVVRMGTTQVVGVVYGQKDAETIEQFARRDESGQRTPEVVRVTSFAVAHYESTLPQLSGTATGGVPLAEYLRE